MIKGDEAMVKFRDKRTGELKEAFKTDKRENRIFVQFTDGGKEYGFSTDNIEILEHEKTEELLIYSVDRVCYKCAKDTEILTYIKFDDGTDEDLVYPWDKNRLIRNNSVENVMSHIQNPAIEYYPIKTIGTDELLDTMMLRKFPERIRVEWSNTQKRKYSMNVCQHCGAKQGEYFIYEKINKMIQKMSKIKMYNQ